jgi:hypothetical protein
MSAWRKLRKEEANLITAMIRNTPKAAEILASLSDRLVEDMQDGGMGSLRFRGTDHPAPRFGKQIAEAEFIDEDGVLASAAVNLDETGELFELDIWKVDFSPLRRYPRPDELRVKPASQG